MKIIKIALVAILCMAIVAAIIVLTIPPDPTGLGPSPQSRSLDSEVFDKFKNYADTADISEMPTLCDTIYLSDEHRQAVREWLNKSMETRKESEKIAAIEDSLYHLCTTSEACDIYLRIYPRGRYVSEVEKKKEDLNHGFLTNGNPVPQNAPVKNTQQSQKLSENYPASPHTNSQKKEIKNRKELYSALAEWDDVKDNGKQFWEKYEITNDGFKKHAEEAIARANRMGQQKYKAAIQSINDRKKQEETNSVSVADAMTELEFILGF